MRRRRALDFLLLTDATVFRWATRCARVLLLALWAPAGLAQGSVVLIGGGSEEEGGWSDAPYRWIVDHAANKKVAVISYAEQDNWIPNYFVSLGAAAATNFRISTSAQANDQATYDALLQYDAFFFKGGDQSIYYKTFKGTRVFDAIVDKYNSGGVIAGTSAGMAILSGVVYTAEKASVYPDEALHDLYDGDITLADDFLPFFPGYIFDTHFIERGRVARLLPFMANWYLTHGVALKGIGVDDQTALCINPDRTAQVMGSATVSFYTSDAFASVHDARPVASDITAVQLQDGHEIDLNTFTVITGPTINLQPKPATERGDYEVLLSGSNGTTTNAALLARLMQPSETGNDSLIIVTAPGNGRTFVSQLRQMGAALKVLETTAAANGDGQRVLRNSIRRAQKVLFVENNEKLLFDFINGGPTGELLRTHMRRLDKVTAFVGDDSRFAGRTYATNTLTDKGAAYNGRLAFSRGLGLLATTMVMPNTYDAATSDFYENTTAAVSFGMVRDSCAYGIYLNRGSYLRFYHIGYDNVFQVEGEYSALVLVNQGTTVATAKEPATPGGALRNSVAFGQMHYAMLNGGVQLKVGRAQLADEEPYTFESPVVSAEDPALVEITNIFPNPSHNGIFNISEPLAGNLNLTITDAYGRTVPATISHAGQIDLSGAPGGVYWASWQQGSQRQVRKLIKL